MKKYNKPQIIAKNLPTGSYAAGCPSKGTGKDCVLFFFDPANGGCRSCERTK